MLTTSFIHGIARRFAALASDRRAMVLQETAVIMPLLVTMMLGGYDVARLSLLQQKLSRVVMTTSDMVSQGETISIPEIDIIFNATGTIIQPFGDLASQIVIVSSVSTTGAAPPKIDWQRMGGGTLPGNLSKIGTANNNATLPPGFVLRDGDNTIITEAYYKFVPLFSAALVPETVLYHRAMFRPRQSTLSVLCANPC